MSQRQQLERILEIDRQIRDGRCPNAQKLADLLEVSRRVIFLDRQFMIDRLGAPIQYDRHRNGWYYTDSTYALPSVMVTEGEMLAFFLTVEIARRSLGTSLENDLRSAVAKITASLKGPVTVDLETLQNHYTFAVPAVHEVNERLLLDLYKAIREKNVVCVEYFTASRNAHTTRNIEPYHLYNLHGDWYLIAFDHMRGQIRNFQLGRVERWSLLEEHFRPDPSFKIEEWMGQAFQTERGEKLVEIAIRFDAFQARYIRERRWHETQQVENLPNGDLILRFQSSGLNEVCRWVMQYGSHAEVLAPSSLRDSVANEVEKMNSCYSDDSQRYDNQNG